MGVGVADVFASLGLALGLGLLVGLEREFREERLAGIRTFPLVTAFGTVCALLAGVYGGAVVAAGLVGLALLLLAANGFGREAGRDPGLTTEIALLLMFGVGVYLVQGSRSVAIVVGAGVAVLLQAKTSLHRLARGLTEQDLTAIMRFALLALVTLPVLPDRTFGPYDVLNPRKLWLMVVLIVGMNLAGYVAYKIAGERVGIALTGILGGLISSTATTVSSARATKAAPATATSAAVVITMASTIVFGRILAEIGAVAPSAFPALAPPIAAMAAVMVVIAVALVLTQKRDGAEEVTASNPSELKSAFSFAALYAVVLLAVAFAKDRWGQGGLYVVAVVSGLTDVDAITLSTAGMVGEGRIDALQGWRTILAAALSNMLFKTGVVAVMGHPDLLRRVGLAFGAAIAAGILIIVFGGALAG